MVQAPKIPPKDTVKALICTQIKFLTKMKPISAESSRGRSGIQCHNMLRNIHRLSEDHQRISLQYHLYFIKKHLIFSKFSMLVTDHCCFAQNLHIMKYGEIFPWTFFNTNIQPPTHRTSDRKLTRGPVLALALAAGGTTKALARGATTPTDQYEGK